MSNTLTAVSGILGQLQFARDYTFSLLADIAEEDWFTIPPGASTHVAWRVGHLAMAEYGLCLFRVRGRVPEDLQLMPSSFRKQFSKGSVPTAGAENYPTPAEIRAVLATIHEQVRQEVTTFTAAQLEEPADMPYAVTPTKLGSLYFCPLHEMLHAGQIGLLRRLLGKSPVR